MFDQKQKQEIQKMIEDVVKKQQRQIFQSDFLPGVIKRRHIQDVVIVFGLDANLPTNASTGIRAYFATDVDTLYLWNGTAWVSEILT